MIHASLFSGIGGPEVAAKMMGWDNAFHCEINPFGRAVLEYWFPESKSYEDITKTNFKEWRGRIDVLTGGFPCQPFSYAGKRGGRDDERYLWPEMLRVIDEVRPTWVVGENVAGITTMVEGGVFTTLGSYPTLFQEGDELHRYELDQSFTIERICGDIERLGYSVQPVLVPAAAVGAPHRRDRVFIIAHDDNANRGNDLRISGEDEGEGEGERVRERDEVRDPGIANKVRSQIRSDASHTEEQFCDVGVIGCSRCRREPEPEPELGNRDCEDDVADADVHRRCKMDEHIQPEVADGVITLGDGWERNVADTVFSRRKREDESGDSEGGQRMCVRGDTPGRHWAADGGLTPENRWAEFPTISPVHRGDDGLPFPLDDLAIPFTKWRTESLKAYGNAIVPQVMFRIFQAIEQNA